MKDMSYMYGFPFVFDLICLVDVLLLLLLFHKS